MIRPMPKALRALLPCDVVMEIEAVAREFEQALTVTGPVEVLTEADGWALCMGVWNVRQTLKAQGR